MKKIDSCKRSKMKKSKVISFDLFGTLVNRAVSKITDVFFIVDRMYQKKYRYSLNDFAQKRIDTEQRMRANGLNALTLDFIYKNIDSLTDEERTRCALLEQQVEKEVAYRNQIGYEWYQAALRSRKEIIVITDMYLPKKLLREILIKCGYLEIDKIFVSGEMGVSKALKGKIYGAVSNYLHVSCNDIYHIGDNIKSDFMNAVKSGVRCSLIQTRKYDTNLEAFLINTSEDCSTFDKKFGYQYFGPFLVEYASWIYKNCRKRKIEKLYFFSREGAILKTVFDKIFNGKMATEYLYVSRHSLSVPLLQFCNSFEELNQFIYLSNPEMNMRYFFQILGIEDKKTIFNILEEFCLSYSDKLTRIRDRKKFFKRIKPEIDRVSVKQLENIKKYLLGVMDCNNKRIGVVDIGWTGQMQHNFTLIMRKCGIDSEVVGFFIGQKHQIVKYLHNGMQNEGFLFDYKKSKDKEPILSACDFLELALHPRQGTTLSYDKGKPVLADLEISEKTMKQIENLQSGILYYIEKAKILQVDYGVFKKEDIKTHLVNTLKNPNMEMVDHFGEWSFNEYGDCKLAAKVSMIHFRSFFRELLSAKWTVAFLKRNIRVRIPYYYMYVFMKKIWKQYCKYCGLGG